MVAAEGSQASGAGAMTEVGAAPGWAGVGTAVFPRRLGGRGRGSPAHLPVLSSTAQVVQDRRMAILTGHFGGFHHSFSSHLDGLFIFTAWPQGTPKCGKAGVRVPHQAWQCGNPPVPQDLC